MRALGLLCLLAGCVVLLLPTIGQLTHRVIHFQEGPILGGILIGLGVIAIILTRRQG